MFNYKPGPPVQKETSVKMQIGPGLYLLSPFHHLPQTCDTMTRWIIITIIIVMWPCITMIILPCYVKSLFVYPQTPTQTGVETLKLALKHWSLKILTYIRYHNLIMLPSNHLPMG